MAQQRLAPDAILAATNLSGTVSAIQDDPDSPDASWLTAPGSNNDTAARVSFPTPTNPPTSGAGLQNFRVLVRKTNHSTNPTCTVELYEAGALVATLVNAQTISSTTGVVLSGTWNAASLGTASGASVECRVTGTVGGGSPGNRASVEVGAIEWNAETSASSGPVTVAPGVAALAIAGVLASVAVTANVSATPAAGALSLTAVAPTVVAGPVASFSYSAAGKDSRSLAVDIPDNPDQVAYVIWANEGTAVSDVTIGGVSCSLIASGDWNSVTGLVKVSRLINPPTGAQTLSLPGAGSVESLVYVLVVAQGAQQSGTPEASVVIDDYVDEGFSTTTDVDITATDANALIIGVAIQGESSVDPDPVAPLIARAEAIGSQAPYGRSISAATRASAASGTLTLEWTHALNDLSAVAIEVLPAAASGTTVSPVAGALDLAGVSATVATTAHVSAAPAAGALAMAGAAPTVSASDHQTASPASGALTLTGAAATVTLTADRTAQPQPGALSMDGAAATVDATANVWSSPAVGALDLVGARPTVTASDHRTAAPITAALDLAGAQPTVAVTAARTAEPQAGAVTLAGVAPTVTATANVTSAPAAGSLTLAGVAPAVSAGADVTAQPAAGTLTLDGAQATVQTTAHVTAVPGAGALVLSGVLASVDVTADVTVAPMAGDLTLAGASPVVNAGNDRTVGPQPGTLTLAGAAPTVARTEHVTLGPAAGVLTLVGAQATVFAGNDVDVAPSEGALLLAGAAAAVAVTEHVWSVPTPGDLALAGAGAAVDATANRWAAPAAGALVLAGVAPDISTGDAPPITDPITTSYAATSLSGGFEPVLTLTEYEAPS